MPTMFEPVPPFLRRPASSRMPNPVVHSAPAYVVGMATPGSPVAAETAFVVSTALPPPAATSRSDR